MKKELIISKGVICSIVFIISEYRGGNILND